MRQEVSCSLSLDYATHGYEIVSLKIYTRVPCPVARGSGYLWSIEILLTTTLIKQDGSHFLPDFELELVRGKHERGFAKSN